MEACAENEISLIILDRPNPNVHYIDGPILEEDCKSFVGMHPVKIVYGMTIGDLTQKSTVKCFQFITMRFSRLQLKKL